MTLRDSAEDARSYPDDPDAAPRHDVAILGGTLSAGLLGAVLARQGVKVLLVGAPGDASEASGETTVPYTAEVFLLLAKRFEVPEIAAFGLFSDLPAEIRAASGIKKSLGFLYHEPDQPQDPRHSVQFNVPGEHAEWHLHRPTVDRYARELAARYGARVTGDAALLADAWTEDGQGLVRTTDGATHRARYLVDCSGVDSPLVRRNGGDDAEPALRHRSRVYTVHMREVTPFEEVTPLTAYRKATPWSQGTVHHLFDGGWVQMVDFANHPEGRNPVTSVTLSVDPERFEDLPDDPEKAFHTVVERYPDLARQFERAEVVGAWTAEPRWQRTATRSHGPGWFALERSAARNDMFLARDVTTGVEAVHALAAALIHAVREDDWSPGPFTRVATFQQALSDYNDRLLEAARTASRSFALWNAFSRVWLLWQILADLSLKRARLDCEADPRQDWTPVEEYERGGIWFAVPAGLREVIGRSLETLAAVRAGELQPQAAADRIFADLRREPCVPPLYDFGDPSARVYHFTMPKRLKMLWWVKTKAPADFRRLLTRDNVTSRTSESSR